MTTHLNRRERYILLSAFQMQVMRLREDGDYPERPLHKKLMDKARRWVYEIEGDITSDEGVGE